MPGYAWGGQPHARWVKPHRRIRPGGAPGELDEAGRRRRLYRLVQVAYDGMIASNPNARLIFPSLSLVDTKCDSSDRAHGVLGRNGPDSWPAQRNRQALVENGFFFHDGLTDAAQGAGTGRRDRRAGTARRWDNLSATVGRNGSAGRGSARSS